MKKITISDFSGGIQEATSPNDFSPRQWAQLKGIVPSSDVSFETQWGIQTLGTGETNANFQAVYPLASKDGVFLVAISTTGQLWWAKAPAANASYTTANTDTVWAQITTAKNLGWEAGNSTTQPSISIDNNIGYKFICGVPLSVYKYYRNPLAADKDNPSKDTDIDGTRTVASGVLIHSADRDGSQQAVIVYIDTTPTLIVPAQPPVVSAVTFPNLRRLPQHGDAGDFINARLQQEDGSTVTYTVPNWMKDRTGENFHPYTWVDINATLRPGTGIIPRANVGTMKGDKLILGDIEWRTEFTTVAERLNNLDARRADNSSTAFGLNENGIVDQYIKWPDDAWSTQVPTYGRVIYNSGPGIVYISDTNTIKTTAQVGGGITNVARDSAGIVTITTAAAHSLAIGTTVTINVVGDTSFNGVFTVVTSSGSTFTYYQTGKPVVASTAATGTVTVARTSEFKYKVEVGAYQTIPNAWDKIYVHASVPGTRINVARQLNSAAHLMNDGNTGPHRGSIYYSEEDLDQFDPRSVLKPSKSDVRIAGLHTLDDTIVVITTAGTEGDGVLRIRGFLSRLHPYTPGVSPDPNAVRIELIRGGIGAPEKTSAVHKNFSTVWSEAGIVVFIDRLGGIFYTDGQACDRLDRFGPVTTALSAYPHSLTREDDHVSALGKHLFAYRAGRLLCFTMLGGEAGQTGTGCWTEIVLPSGACKSFVGSREDLYFINAGKVMRFATLGPANERGTINGQYNAVTNVNGITLSLTVSTATLGSDDEHDRTNWHRFGMTFDSPTATNPVYVSSVIVRSSGALSAVSGSEPKSYIKNLNRTYDKPAVLGEFMVPAGIGPQAAASATVTFFGHVKLKSAAFWTTGREPRRGDN